MSKESVIGVLDTKRCGQGSLGSICGSADHHKSSFAWASNGVAWLPSYGVACDTRVMLFTHVCCL